MTRTVSATTEEQKETAYYDSGAPGVAVHDDHSTVSSRHVVARCLARPLVLTGSKFQVQFNQIIMNLLGGQVADEDEDETTCVALM
eukprot:758238-Hanusia_phi.AAC.1